MIRWFVRIGLFLPLFSVTVPAFAYFAEDFHIEREAPSAPEADIIAVTPVLLPEPDTALSRALFTAMIVEKHYASAAIHECYWDIASSVPPDFSTVFADVSTAHPYAKHLCIAMRDGLIRGYGDGTFRPDQSITTEEAARILARSAGWTPWADATHYDQWYEPYLWALSQRNALPTEIACLGTPLTVRVATEMTLRVTQNIIDRPSQTYDILVHEKHLQTQNRLCNHF